MKRSDVDEEDKFYTGKASDVMRQLALLGYAVIWIFKKETTHGPAVPSELKWSAILFGVALFLDFVQYVSGAIGWTFYNKSLYKRHVDRDEDVDPPSGLYYLAYAAFFGKIVALAIAYLFLLYRLYSSPALFASPR
jgi:hypothetical protein